jgi:hypothetical protein
MIENTKEYLSAKVTYIITFLWLSSDSISTLICSNKIPIPNVYNKPCLFLYAHTTFLLLAFLSNAFIVTDLTPTTLYSLKVLLGSRQLFILWKESIKDVYVFRRLLWTSLGVELSDKHLLCDFLRLAVATS